ncbi:hypothetical protein GOV10_03400 [Candidatus Woesearchaeota archaeon]|nr:hypothetical protein [Candidatus Woesearchaeota archaeon]
MHTRIEPSDKFYSQLEDAILEMLEENPLKLADLTAAVNQYAEQHKYIYSNLSQPEIACVVRDLCAQRKVSYKKFEYYLNLRGVL